MLLSLTNEDELNDAIEKRLNSLNETHLHYVGDTPLNCCRDERDLEHSPVAYFRDDRLEHIITEEDGFLDVLSSHICQAIRTKEYYPIDNGYYRADLDIPLPMYLAIRRQVDMNELINEVNSQLEGETSLRYLGDSFCSGEEPCSAKALFYDAATEEAFDKDDTNLPF